MRDFEDRLRDDLRRTEAVVTMSKETMLVRVARARRRRSAMAGVGAAAAAVLGLTIAVPALTGSAGGDAQGIGPRLVHQVQLVNVLFTDLQHGYAVQERCSMLHPDEVQLPGPGEPTPDVQRDCTSQLLATADAGQSWQERALPAEVATKDAGVEIRTGHSLMFWAPAPGTIAFGSWNRRYWTSGDGGVTWTESPTQRDVGPPGSLATFGLDDRPVFLATSPPTGEQRSDKNPLVAASDGSYWLACVTNPCIRGTHDSGQTWQVVTIGPPAQAVDWVATTDGQTLFASFWDGAGSTLIRSTDAGGSWEPIQGVALAWRGADAVALPNGDLIMTRASEAGGMFRMRAGSTTVEELAGAPTHVHVLYRTGGWLVAATGIAQGEQPELPPVAWISGDNGTTWIAVPTP
ncbi:MAG TPA: sialidase family protein [Candidatus Limnocylindrales bacterium]